RGASGPERSLAERSQIARVPALAARTGFREPRIGIVPSSLGERRAAGGERVGEDGGARGGRLWHLVTGAEIGGGEDCLLERRVRQRASSVSALRHVELLVHAEQVLLDGGL